jgi:hypothetical protein
MSRSPRRSPGCAVALAILAAAAGCTEEELSEILITVDTTFGVPCTVDHLRFEVTGRGAPVTREVAVEQDDLPGSFRLVPKGGPGPVSLRVTALQGDVPIAVGAHDTEFAAGATREVRFLLDESCVSEPCDAVAGGPFEGLPEPAPRKGCGEAYQMRPTLTPIPDACEIASDSRGALLEGFVDGLEASSPLDPPMPFRFLFYGRPVTQLWVGDNGYVGFGEDPPEALVADVGGQQPLGEGRFPVPGILPFWEKLKTGARGVCLAVAGEAPYRVLWITWSDACFREGEPEPCGDLQYGRLRFSVGMEETSNAVYLGYLVMEAEADLQERAHGLTAVIGISDDVPRPCPLECDDDGLCPSGEPCGFTEYSSNRSHDALPALEFLPQ